MDQTQTQLFWIIIYAPKFVAIQQTLEFLKAFFQKKILFCLKKQIALFRIAFPVGSHFSSSCRILHSLSSHPIIIQKQTIVTFKHSRNIQDKNDNKELTLSVSTSAIMSLMVASSPIPYFLIAVSNSSLVINLVHSKHHNQIRLDVNCNHFYS